MGHEIARLQHMGERVRVRGEKQEAICGPQLQYIGMKRTAFHSQGNAELLAQLDPGQLKIHLAPERWDGRFNW